MGLPKTVRFDDELENLIKEYIHKNKIRFSQLLTMAISKFISEHHAIELTPVSAKKWRATVEKAYRKHKHALVKLK